MSLNHRIFVKQPLFLRLYTFELGVINLHANALTSYVVEDEH